MCLFPCCFFFNDTATTEIYTLSLHDALPIRPRPRCTACRCSYICAGAGVASTIAAINGRSEEHTSELQSLAYLVCRLLLEKKKQKINNPLCNKKNRNNQHK